MTQTETGDTSSLVYEPSLHRITAAGVLHAQIRAE